MIEAAKGTMALRLCLCTESKHLIFTSGLDPRTDPGLKGRQVSSEWQTADALCQDLQPARQLLDRNWEWGAPGGLSQLSICL